MRLVICVVLGVVLNLPSAAVLFASSSADDIRNICARAQQSLQRLSFCLDVAPTDEMGGEHLSAIEEGEHICLSIMQVDRRQNDPATLKTMAWLLRNLKKNIAQTYRQLGSRASGLDKVKHLQHALKAYQCSVMSAVELDPAYEFGDQLEYAVTLATIQKLQADVERQVAHFTGCAQAVQAMPEVPAGGAAVRPMIAAPAAAAAASAANSHLYSPLAGEHQDPMLDVAQSQDAMLDNPVPDARPVSSTPNPFLLESPPPMRFGASSGSAGLHMPPLGQGLGSPLHLGGVPSQEGAMPAALQSEDSNFNLAGNFGDERFMEEDGQDYYDEEHDYSRSESPSPEEAWRGRAAASSAPAPRITTPSPNLQSNERVSCHICKTHKPRVNLKFCSGHRSAEAKAKTRKCRKKFCPDCLQRRVPPFSQSASSQFENNSWQCPACADVCPCAQCKRKRMSSH